MEIRSEPVSAKRNFSSKLWKCFVVMECVYKEELGFSVNEYCNWDCFRIGGGSVTAPRQSQWFEDLCNRCCKYPVQGTEGGG